MSPARDTAHFDALYAANADPWHFTTSAYEAEKYDATLAALGERMFVHGFEVGCSIGVLTARLGTRCQSLLAIDVAAAALNDARTRNKAAPHIIFEQRAVPDDWPEGRFDLIIFSEVLYFLTAEEIDRTADLAAAALSPGGVILLVNYLGPIDEPLDGAAAADRFIAQRGASPSARIEAPKFRIDRLG